MVRFANERNGGIDNTQDREDFKKVIDHLGLIELSITDRLYTRSNLREVPSQARLDRALLSNGWERRFPNSGAHMIPRPVSDHVPICLGMGERVSGRHRLFRFENWWLQYQEVGDPIKESWTQPILATDAAGILCYKIKRLRTVLTR